MPFPRLHKWWLVMIGLLEKLTSSKSSRKMTFHKEVRKRRRRHLKALITLSRSGISLCTNT